MGSNGSLRERMSSCSFRSSSRAACRPFCGSQDWVPGSPGRSPMLRPESVPLGRGKEGLSVSSAFSFCHEMAGPRPRAGRGGQDLVGGVRTPGSPPELALYS